MKNKWRIGISSLIILLPMVVGLFLWNALPEKMATHWGMAGEVNGWSSRLTVVVGIPLFLLVTHLFCIGFTLKDTRNREQSKKVMRMLYWLCPVISVFVNGCIYASAFGREFDIGIVAMLLVGIFYLVIGNYLPKCKQNYSIGIRLPWTLQDEGNWNATHRFCGKIWMFSGLLLVAAAWLPEEVIVYVILILTFLPAACSVMYSYSYDKKHR